jgi:acyl-coenzyme A synthetase/AMP-(fatty) acid ligase
VKEVVITGHLDLSREPKRLPSVKKGTKFSSWNDIIKVGKGEAGGDLINFRRASAMTVVYILYSSGTTGMYIRGTCVCPAVY